VVNICFDLYFKALLQSPKDFIKTAADCSLIKCFRLSLRTRVQFGQVMRSQASLMTVSQIVLNTCFDLYLKATADSQKFFVKLQQTAAPQEFSIIVTHAFVGSLGQIRRSQASLMTASQKMLNTCFIYILRLCCNSQKFS
jgi:hypothetical protein